MRSHPVSIFLPSVHGGGAERAMLVFAENLLRRGFEVDLVLANLEGPWRDRLNPGMRVVNLGQSRMLRAVPKLVSYLRSHKPLALYSTITHANIAAACAARLARIECPVVVRQSNAPMSEGRTSMGSRIASRLIPHAYSLADGVIAVSQGVREELLVMRPTLAPRVRVVPTPVLTEDVRRLGAERPTHPWFADKDIPIVVSVGRLQPHKGMFDLVQAFAEVRKRRAARLIILGEGADRARIEREVKRLGLEECVALPGFTHNPFSSMNHANVFVLASHYEGLPNVIIQAMAFGTPIVSTDCKSGPAEILENGRFGALVPVGAIQDLANAIERALTSPKHEAARESAWQRFGAANATSMYLAFAGLPERMREVSPEG